MDDWDLEVERDDDYEYGYDYLYENENRPTDAAEDADEPREGENWWEEDEEASLDAIRAEYLAVGEDARTADFLEDGETDTDEEHTLSYTEILSEIRNEDKARRETGAEKARKRLVRDMKAEALLRMETAARTEKDFRAVQEVWDSNDKSRERYERLHEVLQGDTDFESKVDYASAVVFPRWFNDPTFRQLMRGNFLDYLADCPYEMHDLTTKAYIRRAVEGMKEDHKELLFFLYLRLFSPQHVAALRGQTDRNIRKVRDVAIRKLRKRVYLSLKAQADRGYSHFTEQERHLLEEYIAKEGRKTNDESV